MTYLDDSVAAVFGLSSFSRGAGWPGEGSTFPVISKRFILDFRSSSSFQTVDDVSSGSSGTHSCWAYGCFSVEHELPQDRLL